MNLRRWVSALALVAVTGCTPQQLIVARFGDRSSEALEVADCESNFQTDAMSPDGSNHGLFQINNVHRHTFEEVTGLPWAARYDAVGNIDFAWWLSEEGTDWGPWACRP